MTMVSAEFFAPEMRDVLARLRHVYKVYRIGDTGVVALGGVDLDVVRGEFLAVVGPSGAGKSTILNLLGGLDRASAGAVEVDGQDLGLLDDDALTRYRAERVGFVWQGTARNLVPYLSVRENVRLPFALHGGVATDDEPTAELDSVSAGAVMDAFRAVNREFGVTIVMVTHDLAAARRADRRIRVRDGRILHEGAAVAPVGEDGRVRLPDEAVAMLGGGELEAEVTPDEVRLRRRSETGHA
jgi:ABC-type lipoprotein export system ATPase subunit